LLSAIHGVNWAGLDPSNAMKTGNEHIALVQGRGNAGISPVAGIIASSREQNVDVKVDVVPRAAEARFRCIRAI
jgi:transglutaminase-like putative cysteine protease